MTTNNSNLQAAVPAFGNTEHELVQAARALVPALTKEAKLRDASRDLPHAEVDLVRKAGITAARVPVAYGGKEASYENLTQIFILLAKGDSNIAQLLIPHFTSLERIRLMGSEAQKQYFFQKILSSSIIGGATSERGGKFRTDIVTTLSQDGDGYRLNGQKFYSTGSLFSDQLRVTAVNDAGERVSVVIPRERAGITLLNDWKGMGQRTTASGTSQYDNVRVEQLEVIPFGEWETKQRNYGSSAAQILHATIEAGIAFAVLDDAICLARTGARPVRESGVERSVDDPYVQHVVGQISARANAAEAAVLRAARILDRAVNAWHANPENTGSPVVQQACIDAAVAIAEARIATHDAGLKASELLYEVAGASATLEENGFDRHWRNARTHTTHDPISYKFKTVGNFLLNGEAPPVSFYY